ncbi:hypothetical protein BJ138DRAFT_1144220 [Hygrophoropsis aurantiaca]|uniref:Uncharacterized protein n=1 Tax=Hygrophoropsis aurantiaca TaxID=72124 RepID=A0ACB8AM66_9AGAM|nr:hypothetical protein BJ138DRAFT_1144220 [Hygrophoropsis aurantiaca]
MPFADTVTWTLALKAMTTVFHSVAILCTVFRLLYRWYTFRFWWEDAWAALALVCDITCLVCLWVQMTTAAFVDGYGLPPSGSDAKLIALIASWIQSISFTCVLWAARMSVMFAIIRVSNPAPEPRRLAICILVFFGLMWLGLLGQKIYICDLEGCVMKQSLAIAQLITDTISDAILVVMPWRLLRDIKLSDNRRILISCAFSASLLITVVTILHSVLLFGNPSTVTVAIAHIKAAISLIVCNLLVIVTFVYRAFRKFGGVDLDHSFVGSEPLVFTSIDLAQLTMSSSYGATVDEATVGGTVAQDTVCGDADINSSECRCDSSAHEKSNHDTLTKIADG